MKIIVNSYENSIGSIVQYAVRGWTINVYAAERFVLESKLTEEQKNQLSQPGVYLLVNDNQVYIGQSTNILDRWNNHMSKSEKDWFDCAYAITDIQKPFDAAELNALEYLFHSKALESGRFDVTNEQSTSGQKSDYETNEEFFNKVFNNVNLLLNNIYRGHRVFNKKDSISNNEVLDIFYFKNCGCDGKLRKVDEGWLLLKGSKAIIRDYEATVKDLGAIKTIKYARVYLEGKLDENLLTTEDVLFSSPSTPAVALSLQTQNGWKMWKDSKGQLLEKYTELRNK